MFDVDDKMMHFVVEYVYEGCKLYLKSIYYSHLYIRGR